MWLWLLYCPKYGMDFSKHIASSVFPFSPVHTMHPSGGVWDAAGLLGQPQYVTSLAGGAVSDLLFKLC